MLRTTTCLCVLQVLFALRDSKVAHLIPDQPTFIDTPTPTVPASSAIVTASEEVAQVQDLEVDLSKIDLAKLEELPNCTNGELRLSAKFYKVTRHVEIQESCRITADGSTLLVTTTLKFVETARLDGKLSVKAMNALQGPCFAFQSDAFVAASAELHLTNCRNIVEMPDEGEIPDEANGGAMNVGGSLTVMGTLIIHDCSTEGYGGAIAVKQDFFHSNGSISIINSSAVQNGGSIYVEHNFHHSGGSISIEMSSGYKGGSIYVQQNFIHSGGNISIEGSSAKYYGGAIYVKEHFTQSAGSLAVTNSSAEERGGAICVKDNFHHSGGNISVKGTSAKYGGAIYVLENFTQSGGSLAVMKSSSQGSGGAIFVKTNFNHTGGNISVEGSSAKNDHGGAIYVEEHFTQSGGSIVVMNASTQWFGGAIYVLKNFNHWGGNISVKGSSAKFGGAIYVLENFTQSGGSLAVMKSSSQGSGGAIDVRQNFNHSGGNISVEGSSAKNDHGGAIYVKEHFTQSGGSLVVIKSSAGDKGGAIFVKDNFHRSGGNISVKGTSAKYGGAIFVDENFAQSGGSLAVKNSSAQEYGGAIYVRKKFTQSGGSLAVMNSSAGDEGGAIYVSKNFDHSGGSISVEGSSSRRDGGAINVKQNFHHSGGNISVEGSSTRDGSGGAIYVSKNFDHSGGNISVEGSSARYRGGAIYVKKHFAQSDGSLAVMNSSAQKYGGGLFLAIGHVVFTNATATFSQCHAGLEGGGIKTHRNVSLTNASLSFELATAVGRGAALVAHSLEQVGGRMTVYNSSASGASGDVIDVAAWAIDGGSFRIEHCKSNSALLAAQLATLNATSFDVADCSAAGMLVSSQVLLRNSVFSKTSLPQVRAPLVDVSNCTIAGSEAWISAEKATVKDIDCDVPFAARDEGDGLGCRSCEPGTLFVKNSTTNTIKNGNAIQRCVPCPDGAKMCNATAVEMMPGRMVELSNLSKSFHCPNQLACRGGAVSSKVSTQMCAGGYEGEGCSQCAEGCARSDSNVFICVRCAEGLLRKVKDVLVFLLSNTLLFVVSAAGVINAQGRNKNSAVYLNQLMSFAAVTAPALLALQQTGTFNQQLQQLGKATIAFFSIPVQAGDAGESSVSISTECLQRYMGMEPSLLFSQLISSLLYIVLMLCLALKSGRSIAAVVGVNCFLPKVCATFGWYLIVYRMEPLGERLSLLEAQHQVAGMVIAVLAIILCFMVGPGSWIKMTRDKSVIDKPHVLFLTRSYREGFETWEVEKLTRRMVLKVISTVFPITLNPSMQMAGVTLVLIASFSLHATQAPYAKEAWNQIELGLLATALVTVVLTTLCLANEMHWAHSDETQITLILGITAIVAVAGGLQSFLLGRELLRERLGPPNTDAAEVVEDGEENNS
eukprot:symbB.v1.2.029445.t2/scaffold3217.1/size62816/2